MLARPFLSALFAVAVPAFGLAQTSPDGRPATAPLDAKFYLQVELECPTYGTGDFTFTRRNTSGLVLEVYIRYMNFEPAYMRVGTTDTPGGEMNFDSDRDVRHVDWSTVTAFIYKVVQDGLDGNELTNLLESSSINVVEFMAYFDTYPAFQQVCNNGDVEFTDRYREFLRRNRADLEAAPGTPLYNERDPIARPFL